MSSLSDKIIISTRPLVESDSIKNYLTEKGALVMDFPMVRTECVELTDKLKSFLNRITEYDWIVFTSKNGVISFYELLEKLRIKPEIIALKKIAVMGKATGDEVLKRNGNTHLISQGRTAEDLLTEIKKQVKPTDKILLALGELAENKLETGLKDICLAHRINVYKTIDLEYKSNELIDRIREDKYNIIIFTSPSGFRNFNKIMSANRVTPQVRAACIGTTTEKELLKNNCQPLVVSPKSDAESFANAIELFLNNNKILP